MMEISEGSSLPQSKVWMVVLDGIVMGPNVSLCVFSSVEYTLNLTSVSTVHIPIVRKIWKMLRMVFFVQLMNMNMVQDAVLQIAQWRRSEEHKLVCNIRISRRNMFSSTNDKDFLAITGFSSQQWKLQSGGQHQMMRASNPMMHQRRRNQRRTIFLLPDFIVLKQFVLHVELSLLGLNLQDLNLQQIFWHFWKGFFLLKRHNHHMYVLTRHV